MHDDKTAALALQEENGEFVLIVQSETDRKKKQDREFRRRKTAEGADAPTNQAATGLTERQCRSPLSPVLGGEGRKTAKNWTDGNPLRPRSRLSGDGMSRPAPSLIAQASAA